MNVTALSHNVHGARMSNRLCVTVRFRDADDVFTLRARGFYRFGHITQRQTDGGSTKNQRCFQKDTAKQLVSDSTTL